MCTADKKIGKKFKFDLESVFSDCKIYSYLYFHVPAQSVSFTRFKLSTWSICPLIFHCQKAWTTRVETVGRHFPLFILVQVLQSKKQQNIWFCMKIDLWSITDPFFLYLALRFISKYRRCQIFWIFLKGMINSSNFQHS